MSDIPSATFLFEVKLMRKIPMAFIAPLVFWGANPSLSHDLSEHPNGECEFTQSEVSTGELAATLQNGEAPCLLVTMTRLAANDRVFLLQDGGQLICENEFEPTTRRSFIRGSVRYLHFSHLSNDSDPDDGELVVMSCGLQHVE